MCSHDDGAQKKTYKVVGVSALKKPQKLIDQITQHGQAVLIVKHGKPLAFMSPITAEQMKGLRFDFNHLASRPVAPTVQATITGEECATPRTDPLKMSQSSANLPAVFHVQATPVLVTTALAIPTQAISFNGQTVHIAEEINLTEMWKASGKSQANKPYNWITKEGSEFIANQHGKDTGGVLLRSVRGRTGGTFAHWQIGMEYARYLSPELAAVCNQIVKDFVEAKPELAQSIVARTSQTGIAKIAATAIDHTMSPQDMENIKNRADSKLTVLELLGEMADRGASHRTIQTVTEENFLAVTNTLPKVINRDAERSVSSSARDLLSPSNLNFLSRLEILELKCLRVSGAKGHEEILEVITSVTGAL